MKRILKGIVPLLMSVGILFSIGWYLFEYDREFTRDFLISQARFFEARGNSDFAALIYDLAYDYTGKDEDVAIELANQYKADGNYTKAEYTLTNAIADGGTVDLYISLCKIFVEQDKLLDAVSMLDSIGDPALREELNRLRPAAPVTIPDPGFYNQYITVDFQSDEGTLLYTVNGVYPSVNDAPFADPFVLPGGETTIYALRVADNGLVSPLTVVGYTVGGVIEEVVFADEAIELALREQLGIDPEDPVMTDRLWEITEFTIPDDAKILTDLSYLPYLEKLVIREHKLESLSPLASLQKLRELDLSGCRFPVADLKILAAAPSLEVLNLSTCALSTVADLAGAANLTYLDLSCNTLRNLEPLKTMPKLRELFLQHNAVTSLEALSALENLVKLDISYNSVSSISPLAPCKQLSWLNAGNNLLSSISGIDSFPALTNLYVDHNKLTDVSMLSNCSGLTELDISNNELTNIIMLQSLVDLVKLNCSYNKIQELPTFPKESALSTLDASYNDIQSIYHLRHMQNLTYVYLDYNRISNIDLLADCYLLVMVNVYGNPIEDVSQLTKYNIIVNYDPTN